MSDTPASLTAGLCLPLSTAPKTQWELGEVRELASGVMDEDGVLRRSSQSESSWQLSVRSVLRAGSFSTEARRHTLTLIIGDFLQISVDGTVQGLEPLRPFPFASQAPVECSQPTEELLFLNLAVDPQRVRGTVRIIELSKKYEQHLFDGQLGMLLQGQATVSSDAGEQKLQLRDTVVGGDQAQVRLSGRGVLAVVSLDSADN